MVGIDADQIRIAESQFEWYQQTVRRQIAGEISVDICDSFIFSKFRTQSLVSHKIFRGERSFSTQEKFFTDYYRRQTHCTPLSASEFPPSNWVAAHWTEPHVRSRTRIASFEEITPELYYSAVSVIPFTLDSGTRALCFLVALWSFVSFYCLLFFVLMYTRQIAWASDLSRVNYRRISTCARSAHVRCISVRSMYSTRLSLRSHMFMFQSRFDSWIVWR